MPNLLKQLETQPVKGRISHAGKTSSVFDLIQNAKEIRQQNPQLKQQNIALCQTNLISLVTELIAFDGWCTAIYICPPHVSVPQVQNLITWPNENYVSLQASPEPLDCGDLPLLPTSWYLATSGTTGEPKWFAHSFSSLVTSIKQSENLQNLCWGLLYQPFRFAGLQVLLQALLSGAELVDATGSEPMAQLIFLQQHHVSAISATPSLWRQLLMTKQLHNLPLRYITLGGEIADQSLLDNLRVLFPKANIRHIYASTEAGVGFVVSDGQAGFPAKWLDDPLRLPVALKVSDTQHLWVKPSHQGSQTLLQQYDKQGYMDTLDQVQLSGDRVLFLGRVTGVINVGGNKVHPEKVEQVLLQCPSIGQAKVYAKKSAVMGELVVADVTVIENADQYSVKQELLKICKTQLQRFEIPTKISVVDNIICEPTGKVNRKLQHG
jgi:acyl-CoA synthetase (AMP-forming)/AMP-acid ligase II